jgi:hypothetical protein
VILRPQVRRQETDGCQVHGSVRQQVEDHGKLPRGPRGLDAVAGGRLGEPEDLGAIPEEGTRAFAAVELAHFEHGKVRDQLDGDFVRALRQDLHLGPECVIGKLCRDGKEVRVHVSS